MIRHTLAIDFDGVIHSYEKGWAGGQIYGSVVPGFFEWAVRAAELFQLAVYSSRSNDPVSRQQMKAWLAARWRSWIESRPEGERDIAFPFHFAEGKPIAWLTIDDRAVRFDGRWDAPWLQPEVLIAFRPWTQAGKGDDHNARVVFDATRAILFSGGPDPTKDPEGAVERLVRVVAATLVSIFGDQPGSEARDAAVLLHGAVMRHLPGMFPGDTPDPVVLDNNRTAAQGMADEIRETSQRAAVAGLHNDMLRSARRQDANIASQILACTMVLASALQGAPHRGMQLHAVRLLIEGHLAHLDARATAAGTS